MLENGINYAGGLNLKFYPSDEFEPNTSEETLDNYRSKARNLLRVLMMGWTDSWRNLLSWQTFNAVVIERNHQLTQAMRYAFQQGFEHVFQQLKAREELQPLTELEKNQAHLFINNCIAYLPYADPSPYEYISIPQCIEGKWELVEYKVVPIELTPTSGFKRLFLADHDRVFAYGLEPINNPKAEPHLAFMGTTYPAGQGFVTTVNTDLEAFETAGKKLYRSGRDNITRWLDQQTRKVHVCGTSLGGALSLLLAIDQGNKLSRVDALNPPGLYLPWRKSRYDHWDEFDEKPQVIVQKNQDDPVSYFGTWKPEWDIVNVIPPAEKRGPNSVADHALNYAGFSDTQFKGVHPEKDNQERRIRNWWLYSVLRSIVYYALMVPIRYLILPFPRFIFSHKIQLLSTIVLMVAFNFYPVPFFAFPLSLALNTILPGIISGYLLATLIHFAHDRFTNKHDSYLSKFLDHLENHPWLKVSVGLLATVVSVSMIAGLFVFPALVPGLTIAISSIPLLYAVVDSVINNVLILFGYNHVEIVKSQDPMLERNEELNNYTAGDNITLTYKQIHDYHFAKRNLKHKPFISEADQHKKYKNTEFTKAQVLERSQDINYQTKTLTFFAPKAKIHAIHRTLWLIESGKQNELEQSQEEYVRGKLSRQR